MNRENSTLAPKVNPAVRWFVVGLPLGLLLMGALSFVFYFKKRHAMEAAAAAPSPYAAMLRKDLNSDDYRRFVRIFEEEIGPRTPDKPDNVETARSFIESTLGYGNMGFQVLRREFPAENESLISLEVELAGSRNSSNVILVLAPYDGRDGKAIAALLCLAQSLTGSQYPNSVRFIALQAGQSKTDAYGHATCAGAINYTESLPKEMKCATLVVGTDIGMILRGDHQEFPALDVNDPDALGMLSQCREMILLLAESRVIK